MMHRVYVEGWQEDWPYWFTLHFEDFASYDQAEAYASRYEGEPDIKISIDTIR